MRFCALILLAGIFLIGFLSGCSHNPPELELPQSKKLGLWEKREVLEILEDSKSERAKIERKLEEHKIFPFLRVNLIYKDKSSSILRQKIQHMIYKKQLKPKKITFQKDKSLHFFLQIQFLAYGPLLPLCPDWSSPVPGTKENESLSQMGCAQQANLGLMLEDPYDLKESDALTPSLAQDQISALDAIHKESQENKIQENKIMSGMDYVRPKASLSD